MARARPRAGLIPARAGKTPHAERGQDTVPAHPRACGENIVCTLGYAVDLGSSPRVRGKLTPNSLGSFHTGLIPARAGKTGESLISMIFSTAHPRACGENVDLFCCAVESTGSSPRVRGKRTRSRMVTLSRRLIPARAGKTGNGRWSAPMIWAHPRACGENRSRGGRGRRGRGSSPRVRGKHVSIHAVTAMERLIPARAGKTGQCVPVLQVNQAHPRACGENTLMDSKCILQNGSSPRVRGKKSHGTLVIVRHGLIPARAGKTSASNCSPLSRRAHPRACGENFDGAASGRLGRGSSPRVRGKRALSIPNCSFGRLIPARAGKTNTQFIGIIPHGAHPRACGENVSTIHKDSGALGSSPRVRGKRSGMRGLHQACRLIPARAGKTQHST